MITITTVLARLSFTINLMILNHFNTSKATAKVMQLQVKFYSTATVFTIVTYDHNTFIVQATVG
jgi:hypothetical protein